MRMTFDTLKEVRDHLKTLPHSKATVFEVTIEGITQYTLSGNSDQAIAAVARKLGAKVASVPLNELLLVEA